MVCSPTGRTPWRVKVKPRPRHRPRPPGTARSAREVGHSSGAGSAGEGVRADSRRRRWAPGVDQASTRWLAGESGKAGGDGRGVSQGRLGALRLPCPGSLVEGSSGEAEAGLHFHTMGWSYNVAITAQGHPPVKYEISMEFDELNRRPGNPLRVSPGSPQLLGAACPPAAKLARERGS